MKLRRMCLRINGADRYVVCDPENDTLAELLRRVGLTGTKIGCGTGICGACSVILNGKVIRSCTKKMKAVEENSVITTIEGIGTPNCLHPLQQAWVTYGGVQCGFCTPGFIVSAYGLLQENANPTREEVRDWFQKHRNICRCTGYKPIVDAVMEAAKVMRGEATMEDISWKDPEDGQIYGTRVPRPIAISKACGVCDYGDDIKLKMPPGTLHLAVVQPRITHHAKILSIDYAEALKMPGVVGVITAKDIKGSNRIDFPLGHPRAKTAVPAWPILADERIRRFGEVVAVVAADTEENARAAAAKVKVELEQLPEYLDFLSAVMPGAMEIHPGSPNVYLKMPTLKGEEDTAEVIENSAHAVEGSFYSTREPHLSIEPDIVQAYWDEDDSLTIQCKAQFIYAHIGEMAGGLGLPAEKIRVIENPTGGSFGYAMNAHSYAIAGACVMALNKPVTMTLSYEEHQHLSGKRSPCFFNGRMACDENGKLTAMELDMGCERGPSHSMADFLGDKLLRFAGFPYYIPNVTELARFAYSNHNVGVSYRGFGAPQVLTATEALVDMLAEDAGMDPFEFRAINVAKNGETSVNSYPFREYPMEGILEKARPIYQEAMARAKAADTPEKRRGVGVACGGFVVSAGLIDDCAIDLELNPDGSVTHFSTWEDQGQGADAGAVLHTCAALKEIGITPDRVRLVMNDSKYCPNSGPAAGSRSHFMVGKATVLAANQLLNAMRKPDGSYRTYEEMVAENIPLKYNGLSDNHGIGLKDIDPNDGHGDPSPTLMYGIFISEVEVDTATGKATVLSYITVDDIGVVGNPTSVEGQAFGGGSHCIGFALTENYDDVKKHNTILGAGIPTIRDIPDDLQLHHCVTYRNAGPFGSAGCSELYQSGGHMAVINAIYHACGVRVYELPATPDKIKAGLEAVAKGEKTLSPEKYFMGSELYDEIEEIKNNPV